MSKKIRVAIYIRVSTEEQKKYGYSIATQKSQLDEFVKAHKEYILVDYYIDEGISAVKIKKRLALQRLLDDIKQNKIDMILFTKLDRWGRSVKIYYQIQEVLDQYNVSWKAIHEDYETATANGKFKVNIMLAVAQQERDKTSERIKDVFEFKVTNGQAICGSHSVPFGFEVQTINGNKIVVHNKKEEPILLDLLDYQMTYNSMRKTNLYLKEKYDIYMHYESITRLFSNPLLYGEYKGNTNFCEPYITKEKFNLMQELRKKNVRVKKNSYPYIFSKLIICPECGKHLVGNSSKYKSSSGEVSVFARYRCENYATRKTCTFKPTIKEIEFEKQLLDNLSTFMNDYIIDCEIKEKQEPKKVDTKSIEKEIERLNNMYLKGRIKEDDYDKKYLELDEKLKSAINEKPRIFASETIKNLVGVNLRDIYDTFTSEEKKAFLSGIIKDIHVDETYTITKVNFL